MLWTITKDHINGKTPDDTPSRVGKMISTSDFAAKLKEMTSDARTAALNKFQSEMNYEFRLFDDDGELYYSGLCKDLDQMDGDQAFEPLDWAEVDAGCTRMDYRKVGGTDWKTL